MKKSSSLSWIFSYNCLSKHNVYLYLHKKTIMNWISYPQNRPTISKTYIVSIKRAYMETDLTFSYIAYYDAETNRWHKNDSFDNDSVKEIITEQIVGWNDDLTTYLG